jgi:CO dehydrogenase/acetyl-CoA synthase alpha subunit
MEDSTDCLEKYFIVRSSTFVCIGVSCYEAHYRIIEENGNNSWLAHGTPHCNVRNDFVNTITGIKPKQKPTLTTDL